MNLHFTVQAIGDIPPGLEGEARQSVYLAPVEGTGVDGVNPAMSFDTTSVVQLLLLKSAVEGVFEIGQNFTVTLAPEA